MQSIIAYLFQIHEPTPEKYAWIAFTFINALMMLWLARERSEFGIYMACAAVSSILRASPHWPHMGDFLLVAAACYFGWWLLPGGASRWFSVGIGAMLVGTLLIASPAAWPGYPRASYHARLYAAVDLLAVCSACTLERWVRREPLRWRGLIAVLWFAIWFLTLVQWRTDTQTHEYWVQYWHIALAGKMAACGCLAGWITASARESREVHN